MNRLAVVLLLLGEAEGASTVARNTTVSFGRVRRRARFGKATFR